VYQEKYIEKLLSAQTAEGGPTNQESAAAVR
jgi:hypothetical protein